MAKAALPDNRAPLSLSGVVKDAAKRAYGKQGAAAAQLQKDEGNFARDVTAGRLTLADLAGLGPEFLAELGKELVNSYAELSTPAGRIRELSRRQDEIAQELRQLAELVA